jgi:hypothetical protein
VKIRKLGADSLDSLYTATQSSPQPWTWPSATTGPTATSRRMPGRRIHVNASPTRRARTRPRGCSIWSGRRTRNSGYTCGSRSRPGPGAAG